MILGEFGGSEQLKPLRTEPALDSLLGLGRGIHR